MRQEILTAMRADLATVQSGADYNYTIEEVTSKLLNDKDYKKRPTAVVFGLPSRINKRDDFLEVTFPVGVMVLFEVKKDIDKELLLEQYGEKVIEDQLTLWQSYNQTMRVEGVTSIEPTQIEFYPDTDSVSGKIYIQLNIIYIY